MGSSSAGDGALTIVAVSRVVRLQRENDVDTSFAYGSVKLDSLTRTWYMLSTC